MESVSFLGGLGGWGHKECIRFVRLSGLTGFQVLVEGLLGSEGLQGVWGLGLRPIDK